MKLSKRAYDFEEMNPEESNMYKDFPPEVFSGYFNVDYDEDKVTASANHSKVSRVEVFRSPPDFYVMEIFNYEGDVLNDFKVKTNEAFSLVSIIKEIGNA
jgi:hypothetical protein